MGFSKIGQNLKNRRKSLRVTQPELAELAGVSVNTLYKIERGLTNPTLETLEKIAGILGMEICLKVKIIQPKNP